MFADPDLSRFFIFFFYILEMYSWNRFTARNWCFWYMSPILHIGPCPSFIALSVLFLWWKWEDKLKSMFSSRVTSNFYLKQRSLFTNCCVCWKLDYWFYGRPLTDCHDWLDYVKRYLAWHPWLHTWFINYTGKYWTFLGTYDPKLMQSLPPYWCITRLPSACRKLIEQPFKETKWINCLKVMMMYSFIRHVETTLSLKFLFFSYMC